jgi:hypothetical protein
VILGLRAGWRALGIGDEPDDDSDTFADLVAPTRTPRLVVWPQADDTDDDGELAG